MFSLNNGEPHNERKMNNKKILHVCSVIGNNNKNDVKSKKLKIKLYDKCKFKPRDLSEKKELFHIYNKVISVREGVKKT